MYVAVRGQPIGVNFLLPPSGLQELNIRSLQLMSHLSKHIKVKLVVLMSTFVKFQVGSLFEMLTI